MPDAYETPEERPEPILIAAPADGVPPVIDTWDAWDAALDRLSAGTGPLAVDTERAQSFRYAAKAYLIQVRRAGAGTFLIDPVALEGGRERADLSELADALADVEWIIHAATQDLPCLAEVGMLPQRLFDTELAGRLLGLPRVGLSSLTELALGKTLAKEHSAADWSKRPLPQSWLSYAALDVELLAELRDWTARELEAAGKSEWARQEFAFLAEHAGDPALARRDPWRRLRDLRDLSAPLQLAYARELWQTREEVARRSDRAPSRVLADAAIVELAAKASPSHPVLTRADLRAVKGFSWRIPARHEADFLRALERVATMDRSQFPPVRLKSDGPPAQPRNWQRAYPDAFARFNRVRPALIDLAEQRHLPVENLCSPEAVRRLCFEPPAELSVEAVDAALSALLVRPWQRELVAPVVTPLLARQADESPTGA